MRLSQQATVSGIARQGFPSRLKRPGVHSACPSHGLIGAPTKGLIKDFLCRFLFIDMFDLCYIILYVEEYVSCFGCYLFCLLLADYCCPDQNK